LPPGAALPAREGAADDPAVVVVVVVVVVVTAYPLSATDSAVDEYDDDDAGGGCLYAGAVEKLPPYPESRAYVVASVAADPLLPNERPRYSNGTGSLSAMTACVVVVGGTGPAPSGLALRLWSQASCSFMSCSCWRSAA
jgi:hypothetical protein